MISTHKIPDEKDKQIIKLASKRISYMKMTKIIYMSERGIKTRIRQMKDYYKIDSLSDLIQHMIDNNLVQ